MRQPARGRTHVGRASCRKRSDVGRVPVSSAFDDRSADVAAWFGSAAPGLARVGLAWPQLRQGSRAALVVAAAREAVRARTRQLVALDDEATSAVRIR